MLCWRAMSYGFICLIFLVLICEKGFLDVCRLMRRNMDFKYVPFFSSCLKRKKFSHNLLTFEFIYSSFFDIRRSKWNLKPQKEYDVLQEKRASIFYSIFVIWLLVVCAERSSFLWVNIMSIFDSYWHSCNFLWLIIKLVLCLIYFASGDWIPKFMGL